MLLSAGLVCAWAALVLWSNSPSGQFSLMRRNTAWAAERAAEQRDRGYAIQDVLDQYAPPSEAQLTKKNRLYFELCGEAVQLAFRHSSISPETIRGMQSDMMNARRAEILGRLGETH